MVDQVVPDPVVAPVVIPDVTLPNVTPTVTIVAPVVVDDTPPLPFHTQLEQQAGRDSLKRFAGG